MELMGLGIPTRGGLTGQVGARDGCGGVRMG